MDWARKDEFIEKMYRRSKSIHSKRYYAFGIDKFKKFCKEKNLKVNKTNIYDSLDSFVAWLDRKKIKPKTIADYMSAVRKFLNYIGMEVDPTTFKAKVIMPKVTKIADEPLTINDVRLLLTKGRPNPKLRGLILTLLSSGMRIGEALSVKVGDLNLESNPAEVSIKAAYAKTRVGRVSYVSDEAKDVLKEVVKDSPKESLVFEYSGDLWQREKVAIRTFREIVDRAGLGQMIEDHRIHRIHFHSFRKFFLTKAVDLLGDHAGHALCGHGFYMDTYYKKSDDERKADYLKLMPYLTVFGEARMDLQRGLAEQILGVVGYSKEEIASMRLSEMTEEEIQQKAREKLLGAMVNNGSRQKVVPTSEVKAYIQDGWEFVGTLPDNSAIIKLPI